MKSLHFCYMKLSTTPTMQLSFCVAFAVVASVCVELAAGYLPVDGQGYDNGHVGKKGSSSSTIYTDNDRKDDPLPSCTREADYEISQNYIIRTKDSKTNGANFVAALSVRTFDVCLEQCCLKENCDTTIFVGEAYRSEDTNCFLFVCRPEGKNGENRCLFTYHLGYISSMMKALGGFQGFAPDPMTTAILDIDREGVVPVKQIEITTKPAPPLTLAPIEPISNCPDGYFECDSGQCINELYICNSVVDCDDGSDEYRCSAEDPLPAEQIDADQDMQTDGLWNTWPYDYSSSLPDDKVVSDNDLSFQNIDRNRPSYVTPSKSRPHPKGHKLNGIANIALAPPNSIPTPTITLSSIRLAVVTQAPVPIGIDGEDVAELEAVVTVVAPPNEEVTDGKAKDAGKVNNTNVLTEEGNENTVEMVYESHGGSGMPPPSSAILPLVIGLVITVCLLLMVGCRLRYMNQRLRYGRLKTSAHDADYLINGMYL